MSTIPSPLSRKFRLAAVVLISAHAISAPASTSTLDTLQLTLIAPSAGSAEIQVDDLHPGQPSASHVRTSVRVVQLSEVRGAVAIDRNTGFGFQHAYSNLPIVEGTRIQTGDGRAEVEFEDRSTLRLSPYSLVEFSNLDLLPSGGKRSIVRVLKGTAYVSLIPDYIVQNKADQFLLDFGIQKLLLKPDNHVRLDIRDDIAELAVLDGGAEFTGLEGPRKLKRARTFTFSLRDSSDPGEKKGIRHEPQDTWDQWAAAAHLRSASFRRMPHSIF